jgi:hypothetical protein
MANTCHASHGQCLTQPALRALLRVIPSTRDKALLLLAYPHGLTPPWLHDAREECRRWVTFTVHADPWHGSRVAYKTARKCA